MRVNFPTVACQTMAVDKWFLTFDRRVWSVALWNLNFQANSIIIQSITLKNRWHSINTSRTDERANKLIIIIFYCTLWRTFREVMHIVPIVSKSRPIQPLKKILCSHCWAQHSSTVTCDGIWTFFKTNFASKSFKENSNAVTWRLYNRINNTLNKFICYFPIKRVRSVL